MASGALHAVPSDPWMPFPVSMARVEGALKLDHAPTITDFNNERGSATIGEEEYIFVFFGEGKYISTRLSWPCSNKISTSHLFTAANSWNRSEHFPTVYIDRKPDDSVEIVADMVMHCRYGLSSEQLREELQVALHCCAAAMRHVRRVVRRLQSAP